MRNLFFAIVLIFSFANAQDERSILECDHGGFYLNNSRNIALCWGDEKYVVNKWMHALGFIDDYQYPLTYQGMNYCGSTVFGYPVNYVFTNFNDTGLYNINVGFQVSDEELNYHFMNNQYNRLHKYFKNNGYILRKETNPNKIFDREYSSCDGDCGMAKYRGEMLDMELIAFMTGHAEQFAEFRDSLAYIAISIEVAKWQYTSKDSTFILQTKYPVIEMDISDNVYANYMLNNRNVRRTK